MRTQSIQQDIIDRAKLPDSKTTLKIGTSSLIDTERWKFRREWFSQFITNTFSLDLTFAVVTSGAIGLERAERKGYTPKSLAEKQALSAFGQPKLNAIYDRELGKIDLSAGQTLGSKLNFTDRSGQENARNAFQAIRDLSGVPIINENDCVYTDEIRFGDNDNLAAYAAIADRASLLILITDVAGVYTDNPKKNPDAHKMDVIDCLSPDVMNLGKDAGGDHACGGMATKLQAAFTAAAHGIDTIILNGDDPSCVKKLFSGDFSQATFIPFTAHPQMSLF